jgi:hypothetical protein
MELRVKNKNWMTLAIGALLLLTVSTIPSYAADVTAKTGYLTCHEAGG